MHLTLYSKFYYNSILSNELKKTLNAISQIQRSSIILFSIAKFVHQIKISFSFIYELNIILTKYKKDRTTSFLDNLT